MSPPPATSSQPGPAPGPDALDPLAALATLPGVPEALASARDTVDRLRRHRVLRRASGRVAGEAAVRGARASAALEGVDWPLEAVRTVDSAVDDEPAAVVRGALRVLAEAAPLARTFDRAPLQGLARLHVLAAADLVGDAADCAADAADAADLAGTDWLGRPRSGGTPDDPLGLGPAPPPAALKPRLDALVDLVVRPTEAPAIVVAALVHGEVLALRPFLRGNGLVARAAQRLVLHSRGLDPNAVVAPEVGHVLAVDEYRAAARAYCGAAAGTPDTVAAWLRHCADAVRMGAEDGLAVCEALQRG